MAIDLSFEAGRKLEALPYLGKEVLPSTTAPTNGPDILQGFLNLAGEHTPIMLATANL